MCNLGSNLITLASKRSLRNQFKQARGRVSAKEKQNAACQAAALIAAAPFFQKAKHLACYLPFEDEFDTIPLIEHIWQAKKCCYLPVLAEEEKTLSFVRYQPKDAVRPNRYAILEPARSSGAFPAENLEVVFTPLVAFDARGCRLGTGGGYYDRTFSFLHQHSASAKRPLLIGLAYSTQQAEALPVDAWDVLLDGVVTEEKFISFSGVCP